MCHILLFDRPDSFRKFRVDSIRIADLMPPSRTTYLHCRGVFIGYASDLEIIINTDEKQ